MFYHPAVGHPICSKPPPSTVDRWQFHTTFIYNKRLYNCGGDYTEATCGSINLEDDEFKWSRHSTDISRSYSSSVILENKLYVIDRNNQPMSTLLPLAEESKFNTEKNIAELRGDCAVKLNEYSFITVHRNGKVTKYNAKDKTVTQLPQLDPKPGNFPTCVVVDVEGVQWLVVSGGGKSLTHTARLDLSRKSATWELLGDLNQGRREHSMLDTSLGIVALGNIDGEKTVEILNWTEQNWTYVTPSLSTEENYWTNEFVEVPASKFGCQTIALNITGQK